MAKKFPNFKGEETRGTLPKQKAPQDENTRDGNGEPTPDQNTQRRAPISEASADGSHALPAYTASDCTALNVSRLPSFPQLAAIPYKPATSGAVSDTCHHPEWSQLGNQAGATATQHRHQERQGNIAESSSGIVGETLRMLQSLKMNAESPVTTTLHQPSRSQTWIPFNLAQRVSRVYYYSRGYAEEVASGPLEVSGYTVRLSLTCETKCREVVLSFRGQFCACTANETLTWPFQGEFVLTMHHPRDAASNRVYRLRPRQGQETIMPRLVDNVPMHLAGPLRVSALDDDGLWAVGTLHLSIKILL